MRSAACDDGVVTEAPPLFDRSFIDDPYPAYAWLRRLVSKAFTRRRVADFEPRVVEIVDRLLAAFDTEPVDLIRAYR
jgi:cytochrome P450